MIKVNKNKLKFVLGKYPEVFALLWADNKTTVRKNTVEIIYDNSINYSKEELELIELGIETNYNNFYFLKKVPYQLVEKYYKKDKKYFSLFFSLFKNPPEEIILTALKEDYHQFKNITKPNDKIQIFFVNLLKSKQDIYHIVKYNKSFSKIKSSTALHILHSKADNETKSLIKKSKYWKDDANLILEVINE